jgi:predicted ATPase
MTRRSPQRQRGDPAALADHEEALRDAREIGHAATLMYALSNAAMMHIFCGSVATATALTNELVALADEKGASFWKAFGMMHQGSVLAMTGKAANADQLFASGFNALRATGTTLYMPWSLSCLARAHAELGQFEDARRRSDEAMMTTETTKEKWYEAEVHRIAGEIALMSPERDAANAEGRFERALAVARSRKAKSWELRGWSSGPQNRCGP